VDPVRVAAACAIVCQADPSRQDDNKNTPNSLTVEQFMKETIEGFRSNADTIR
jgi:hypothetical protein